MADDDAGRYVRDKLVEQLPTHWQECAHDYDDLQRQANAANYESPDIQSGMADFNGLWFFGCKDGSVYSGLETSGVGNIRLCVPWA